MNFFYLLFNSRLATFILIYDKDPQYSLPLENVPIQLLSFVHLVLGVSVQESIEAETFRYALKVLNLC